jgi:hypothetical protein
MRHDGVVYIYCLFSYIYVHTTHPMGMPPLSDEVTDESVRNTVRPHTQERLLNPITLRIRGPLSHAARPEVLRLRPGMLEFGMKFTIVYAHIRINSLQREIVNRNLLIIYNHPIRINNLPGLIS